MKMVAGWHCPDVMSGPAAYLRRSEELHSHMLLCQRHRMAIQVGGHIGIYPKVLSEYFTDVLTFEPERENFKCLKLNVQKRNVRATHGFLGDRSRPRELLKHSKSSGGHQVGGPGEIPMFRVDDLNLECLDAMFIDVEGFEFFVLSGAIKTIRLCRPLLVLEENGKQINYGVAHGQLLAYVKPLGYRELARVGEDIVLGVA